MGQLECVFYADNQAVFSNSFYFVTHAGLDLHLASIFINSMIAVSMC